MACDKAGRGRCAPTRVVGTRDIEVINPGTAVVLKGDDTRTRATVAAVFIRITGPDEWATFYSLTREMADGRGYDFERPAALVELADPPAAEVADDLTATVPGGRIEWRQEEYGDAILDTAGRFRLIRVDSDFPTPVFFAADEARDKDNGRYSGNGVLPDIKAWCEARLSEPLTTRDTATVAGVNGVAETVPAADAPGF